MMPKNIYFSLSPNSSEEPVCMRASISCFFFCFSLACISGMQVRCDNGSPTSPGSSITELEGTWSGHILGDTAAYSITFAQSNFSIKTGMGAALTDASRVFRANPNTVPKLMDAHITQWPLNSSYVEETSLCIYKISNDTLTIAGNEPGNPLRPTSFLSDTSGTTVVFILKRQ
jgi:uncharacterized protein (TIGR03067 family)